MFLEEMGKSGARDFSGLPGTVKDSETDLENRMEKAQANIAAERSKDAKQQDTARLQALEATCSRSGQPTALFRKKSGQSTPTTMP